MAIDTAAKRSSALDHEEVWQAAAPLPDGTIGQGDRQHAIWSYSGILAAASSAATITGTWSNVILAHASSRVVADVSSRVVAEVNSRVEAHA